MVRVRNNLFLFRHTPYPHDHCPCTLSISFSDPDGEYYSIKELQERAVPGLDYEHREKYLRANDFKDVLGMTKQEFNSLPKWKQTKAKRAAHLF